MNSQKQHLLLYVEGYLPTIIFWFRPVYAVQLGVRFVVQALAGTDEKTHIEATIVKNSQIYRFFIKLWKILLSIYRDGGKTNKGFIGITLWNQIYAGLLEMENLHRGEHMRLPQVNIKLLKLWGDNTKMFQEPSTEAKLTRRYHDILGKKLACYHLVSTVSSSFHFFLKIM